MDTVVVARFGAVLKAHDQDLIEGWTRSVSTSLSGRQTAKEVQTQVTEIFDALVAAADAGATDLASDHASELRAVLTELSRNRALHGFSAKETAVFVFGLKDALFPVTANDATALADFIEFSRFVDEMGLFTFETYARARDELIADQNEQMLELSTPVVKLWDGVLAVPLVGTLDSARAQVVMERLLQGLVETSSPHAIIDITGVPSVDTQVAQHILKTVVAARLMGADCIISGIRPQIAQTVVALGIDFNDIVTKATLADALRHALRSRGEDVVRRTTKAAH